MSEQATREAAQGTAPAETGPQPAGPEQAAPEPAAPEQAGPGQTGAGPAGAPAAPAPGRRSLKRGTKIRLAVIGGIALVIALAFVIYYVVDSRNYVTTNNAQIDGNQISINAPATGTLIDWKGQQGTQISSYQPVGRIAIQAGYSQPQMVIRAPGAGTIAVNNGVEGAFVTAGTQLAVAYDGAGVFVTARVDETQIDAVHPGESAKIEVDAFPDAHLTGHVSEIKTGAAGVFSLFGQSNTTGNFQKVTQVIPVKITIDDLDGLPLVPGMNVTVKIHRG
ncbi:HlyD family secretion protein [Microlunatus ginsengisoli]|uniref:HlyD family efflux transporter periplasmic adaptor subunit n=1 Tax=Microlunatus ginsengisoli TaxID=363863 RepID=A0ABP7AGH0_9ACTN